MIKRVDNSFHCCDGLQFSRFIDPHMSPDDYDTLRGLQACNYSAMGALTFTFWDLIITLDDEVQRIWRRPWTNLKFLYMFLRFFPLGAQLFSAVISMRLVAGYVLKTRGCQVLAGFQGISSQVLMMAVQAILILRVEALYHSNVFLRRLLHVLFVAEVVVMSLIFAFSLGEIRYGPHCVIIYFPPKATGFLIPPILFECLLFVLTMIKFYQALRDGWGREPVISRFMKDGIWAFALPFTILTINTCCMALLSGALSSIAYSWVIAIPGFAGYRLILNLSHLLKLNHHVTSDHIVIDTVLLHMTQEAGTSDYPTSYELHDTSSNQPISRTAQPEPP